MRHTPIWMNNKLKCASAEDAGWVQGMLKIETVPRCRCNIPFRRRSAADTLKTALRFPEHPKSPLHRTVESRDAHIALQITAEKLRIHVHCRVGSVPVSFGNLYRFEMQANLVAQLLDAAENRTALLVNSTN